MGKIIGWVLIVAILITAIVVFSWICTPAEQTTSITEATITHMSSDIEHGLYIMSFRNEEISGRIHISSEIYDKYIEGDIVTIEVSQQDGRMDYILVQK